MNLFTCPACGHESQRSFPRCPACGTWLDPGEITSAVAESDFMTVDPASPATPASESELDEPPRTETGFTEIDRVFGGGISRASAVLITGAPGVGKSTLLMQIAARVAARAGPVLYVSAEESLPQAAARAKRIDAAHAELFLLADNGLEETASEMNRLGAVLVVIDSLQLMRTRYSETAPGAAVQVKEVSARVTELAKKRDIPFLVAGQIIKSGKQGPGPSRFAGPMSVPHLYDGVFHLDESTLPGFILLRVQKNRFGSKSEVGSLRMTARGIEEVPSPSAELLKGGGNGIIAVAMEGTKPIATEIQVGFLQRSDLSEAIVGYPKDRLRLIQTILAGFGVEIPSSMALDVLGGYRIADPAADLAVAIASVFAARNAPMPKSWAAIAEVALDGRLIPPKDFCGRFREVEILGIENIIVPHIGSDSLPPSDRIRTFRAKTLKDALGIVGARIDPARDSNAPFVPNRPAAVPITSTSQPDQKKPEARPPNRERSARKKRKNADATLRTRQSEADQGDTRQSNLDQSDPAKSDVPTPNADSPPPARRRGNDAADAAASPPTSPVKVADPLIARIIAGHGTVTPDLIRREANVSLRAAHELFAKYEAESAE